MNKPFTILIIPLIMGILFNYYFQVNSYLVFLLLVFTLITCIYNIIKDGINQRGILLLFLLLGIFISNLASKSSLVDYIDKRADYIGIVDEILKLEDGYSKYIVRIEKVDNRPVSKERIILNLSSDIGLNLGETIYFNGELKLPMENSNPRLFNYRLNLMTEKIYTSMTLKSHSITRVDRANIAFRYRVKSDFTEMVKNTFDTYLSEKNARLLSGVFLGKSSYLSDDDIISYREMGLAHLLAVSGLHIGIISGFISFILSNLAVKRRINILITLTTIWTYGYLIGFPPSILRSSIMFTILFYSQMIHEPYDSINSVSFAMFILLLINPYYIFNLGFQLSFGATFSIIILAPRIREFFYPYRGKMVGSLASIFGVQLGLLPFQSYYFNSINPLSILANLLIIPIVSFALILGFIMIIFNRINLINLVIGFALNHLLNFEVILLDWVTRIPIKPFIVFSPDFISILVFYIMIFIVLGFCNIKKMDKLLLKIFTIYLILLICVNLYSVFKYEKTELHFIDVGQGDSILIRTKNADYLMDTGGSVFGDYNIAQGITLPYLQKLGVNKLKGIFITHFDEDHSQGLPLLLDKIKVDYLFSSYLPEDRELLDTINSNRVTSMILKENDKLILDDSVILDIIWPSTNIKSLSPNNNSLVSILRTEGVSVLLTGDIEGEAEYFIKEKINEPVDIIKVAHHGSNTSSTEGFLQKIKPRDGIIQVGRNNLYKHPSLDVINRYLDIDTNIYRTDKNGLIKVIIDRDNYEILPYLQEGLRTRRDFLAFLYHNIIYLMVYSLYFMLIYIMVKIWAYRGDDFYDL